MAQLGAEATAVLVLLALAADQQGASFYGRDKMALRLGLTRGQIDAALVCIEANRLVAHRPWRTGCVDGVWQLMPVPSGQDGDNQERSGESLALRHILEQLGMTPLNSDPSTVEQTRG